MSAKRALTEFRVGDEDQAEARAWELVSDAFKQRAPATPRRSQRRSVGVLAAGLTVLISALALSPAGATVGRLITRALGVQHTTQQPLRAPALSRAQALVTDETENRLIAVQSNAEGFV